MSLGAFVIQDRLGARRFCHIPPQPAVASLGTPSVLC
jgi:hypothetical protein